MSESSRLKEILGKAKEEEERYEWLKAADCYQKALTAVAETDFLRKGEISERLAYAVYKAAFQAENSNEFKKRMQQVVEEYGKTRQFYAMGVESETPQAFRCDAMIALAGHWIASEASERKRLVEECWRLTKTALDSFSAAKNQFEYGKTYTHLSIGLFLKGGFLDDYDTDQSNSADGVKYGEQAIECLSQLGDSFKLARVYAQTAIYLEVLGIGIRDPAEKERFCQKALSYMREAKRLSEEAALLESYWQVGWDLGSDESMAILSRTLDYSSKARDRFLIGWALAWLSINVAYKVQIIEDAEERGKVLIKALDYAEKAKLCMMAEKVLETSAESFRKAKQTAKREQVLRMLEHVQKERELAISLREVLHAPIMTSTTTFAILSPTSEKAAGLERFEHANVHANIIVNRNELKVGETVDLEIELANAGKGTALLDRIEGVIPNGFEITEKLQTYRIEGCNVNMKGRRLEQLKGEEVKLSLRPKHKGSFTVRPVVLYIDENGNAKSHRPEPVTITVEELGIKGWIAGNI